MEESELEYGGDGSDLYTIASAGIEPDGYSTVQLPPGLLCREDRLIWERVRTRVLLGLPPANGFDCVIRRTMAGARELKGGPRITIAAVFAAVRLALAKEHGIKIKTHPKGVALHLGVRYQTFLRLRMIASKEIAREGVRLDLPEWLSWNWS